MDIEAELSTATIIALPDTHSESTARVKAENLLRSGKVKIFFIEFQRSAATTNKILMAQYGTSLNSAISEMLDVGTTEKDAEKILPAYFNGINPGDNQPNLIKLTAIAIGIGVQVLACDMNYNLAPDAFKIMGLRENTSLFLSEGLSLRDTHTAQMVSAYLRTASGLGTGRLMLWGGNHFSSNLPFSHYPDATLQKHLRDTGLAVHVATDEEMKE
ncbi:hypothetical protein FNU76_23915 [Chitinimonas arctica]|uniref:Uncharacterized protein n=1 Tax=Chitinimonas arctica TaxID=2594795 RepID=A0A516SLW8_9NEIS|nr:hypothetical protein [Chitinimonas arctica]QDQ29151.1 hypothetical protein FNU76_23915 [Chitinimonas arctica]